MPELPDLELYLDALRSRVVGARLEKVALFTPFLLRSIEPPVGAVAGQGVHGVSRLGKRIVFELEGGLFLVLHLMIAGRLQWKVADAAGGGGEAVSDGGAAEGEPRSPPPAARAGALAKKAGGRNALAAFLFDRGTLTLTEAGTKKRAALHVVAGAAALAAHDPGGIDPLKCDRAAFRAALTRGNHTLKRALTDPRAFSGIGNAYSDEILWRARLSPYSWTSRLDDERLARLHEATQATLTEWSERLRAQAGGKWPAKVTAFRPEMAVHGRYGQPCPQCRSPVQRIVRAENEINYCARCQTDGKVLADRALSQLLKDDWPATLEEWEAMKGGA